MTHPGNLTSLQYDKFNLQVNHGIRYLMIWGKIEVFVLRRETRNITKGKENRFQQKENSLRIPNFPFSSPDEC